MIRPIFRTNTLDRYLLSQFWISFLPLFGALFLIASVVSFVQLSAMTAVIKLSFSEMPYLYILQTPRLVVYTLPVTFFAALISSLARLSLDLETIVLFSLRASVWRIARPFIPVAILLCVTVLFIGLVLTPKALSAQRHFVYGKQDDALINIRANEFGQKFGDWLVFVGAEAAANSYENVALYSRSGGENGYLILASSAEMQNNEGVLRFSLRKGHSFDIREDGVSQMDFSLMRVNESGRIRDIEYAGVFGYWSNIENSAARRREFSLALLSGFFMILCLPAAMIGIFSPRFAKNRSGAWALALSVLFYAPVALLSEKVWLYAAAAGLLWFVLTAAIARRKLTRF
ncbi:permease [Campylobacterota bacterium]|nr:permease [Campylobacterota bacterium]